MTRKTRALGAPSENAHLVPMEIERRETGANDVRIDIEFAGICHSDIHTVRGDWGAWPFPVVPGHEILGTVTEVGANVTKFKVGDTVGVGTVVESCGECEQCLAGNNHFCRGEGGPCLTYAVPDRDMPGHTTHGGYSREIVVKDTFVFSIPENLDKAGAAPLLCAGITVYSPLKHWGAGPGKKIGVAGVGGLGHMAVKLAHAMGAHTVAITSSEKKVEMCKTLGADDVLVSSNADAMADANRSFDLIISTLPSDHNMNPYLELLAENGSYVIVGAVNEMTIPFNALNLMWGHRSIAGSQVGGPPETQEMLDFCGTHNITADIELINADEVNAAYDRVVSGDVRFRFVIDAATI